LNLTFEALTAPREAICPICQQWCRDRPLAEYSAGRAATHFCPPTRNLDRHRRLLSCIRRLWGGDECLILRCENCGFAFGYPHVGGDEEFYSILHEQKGYPAWKWDYDLGITEAINKHPGGNVIDVGAGEGHFLVRLPSNWNRFATEGSDSNRAALRRMGIHVFSDVSAALNTHPGAFEAVTIFQVLEHIAEFRHLLTECYGLLAPGGRLVVTVPDADAMIEQERLTGCADMPPNHVNKFTPHSLTLVLEQVGYEIIKTVFEAPSWRHLVSSIHMRMIADAADPKSIAAQIYKVQTRSLRKGVMALWAGPTLFRMMPHISALRKGGAFGVVATRR
jgi:ubiquinone/menaquinone biosynthesis C-methylase UbiE